MLPLQAQAAQLAPPAPAPTPHISLGEAIHRAESNEPSFAASLAASRIAQLDRSVTRSALLPNVLYHNTYQYTQPNGGHTVTFGGSQPLPIFIANDTVHEYYSQALVNETIGLKGAADLQLANATAARAEAEAEIARRGLVGTVVGLFYGELAAARKLQVARLARDEAHAFTQLTTEREAARESAHADVVKAQLLEQQRERDLGDASLADERARLELAVLLFTDPRTPYTLDRAPDPALPDRAEVNAAAAANNPELRAALAALREGDAQVLRARAAYLPDLGLNLTYGINSPQFAASGSVIPDDGARHFTNLGYSAALTLDIPVWDWLATGKRVRQSQIRRQATEVALSAAQKRLIVSLDEFYAEAATAREQLASLELSARTAEESLRLTKLRYSAGEASVLEVVDAETALSQAQNASADGEVRYRAALANLQMLTGTF